MYDTSSTIPRSSPTISIVKCTRFHPPSHSSSTIPIVKCTTLHPPSPLFIYYPNSQMYDASSTMPPLHLLSQQSNVLHFTTIPPVHLLSQQSNVRHFIHHPPCSSTIPIVKCTTPHPPSRLFLYYPNSQMYDTSYTIPPVHLLSQQSHVRHFIHHPPCSSTIPIVKCTTLHPPSPLFICYHNSQMFHTSSTIPPFIYYPNSQMYDTSSTIPPFHLLSQQSNVRHFIHHPPVHLLSQQSNVRHLIHHPDSSSTIPIVRCTTLHPQSPLFIYCLNSQMYDTSSIIPPVHLLSQQSNVRHLIHHPPCSSTIPIVKCTTPHPPSRLFICYPNSQMYNSSTTPCSSTIPIVNVRHFIHHPPCSSAPSSSTISIVNCSTIHPPSPCSSTIPLVKCTTLHRPSPCSSAIPIVKCTTPHPPYPPSSSQMYDTSSTTPLFSYYPNSQMYDTSSTIPPFIYYPNSKCTTLHPPSPALHLLSQQSNVRGFIHHPTLHLLSQQSNVRHFIHHPPCSSTIPIFKCTTLHQPCPLFIYYPNSQMCYTSPQSPLFIYYPNSQMYDTSSTIPPVHLLSQQSNVRHLIHHPASSSTIPIVKCTILHIQSPLFIYCLNSHMYDTSSTIPPVHLLSQQSNVRHFIHHPPCSSTIPVGKCTTLHQPCTLFIYYPNSQMCYTSSTIPPVHLLSQQSNVRHFIHHPLFSYYPYSQMYDTSSTIPPSSTIPIVNVRHFIHHTPLHLVKCMTLHPPPPCLATIPIVNVRHFIHHPPSSPTISIVKCTRFHPPSHSSSTIPIVKCTTLHPPSPLFIYYPNSQMYDTSSTIPLFIYYLNSQMYDTSSTIPLFIYYPNSQMYEVSSTIPLFIYYPNSQMYEASSTIPLFIYYPNSQMYEVSSTIPLFIYYPNSQMYDTSSTIPPSSSQMYDTSSTTPLFSYYPNSKCTTLHPPSPLFTYYLNSQMYEVSSTIPLFIYYPNSQMYDTSSSIPPVHLLSQQSNVRRFINHAPSSSTIPIVKCTTLHPQSPLFIYCLNSQMYDTSSTIPPVHLLSQQSNVRHLIHHPPCSSTIPIVKCTTPHPPSRLFIYCPNSQMKDYSSTIPPVLQLSQQSNVRRFIDHAPSSSTISIVNCTTIHPPSSCSSTIPIVKCTTLHRPSPLFICYPNSQMYDTSSTIPPFIQSNV